MKGMVWLSLLLALGLGANVAPAQELYIELDLDGTLGNGPDHLIADIGDTLSVDVWGLAAAPGVLIGHYGLTLSGINAALTSWSYYQGYCFTHTPGVDLGDGRWYFEATVFCFAWSQPPYLFGSGEYLYQGSGTGRITIEEPTTYLNQNFETGHFTNNIDATFGPSTATESSSWSKVKELFR